MVHQFSFFSSLFSSQLAYDRDRIERYFFFIILFLSVPYLFGVNLLSVLSFASHHHHMVLKYNFKKKKGPVTFCDTFQNVIKLVLNW